MGALAVITAQAQTHKVGINTDAPQATLDISRPASGVPAGQVEGLLIPRLSQAQRNAMNQGELVAGLQIYNTTKGCIDLYNGSLWQCTDGTQKDNHGDSHGHSTVVAYRLEDKGFTGGYTAGQPLSATENIVTFVVDNTLGTTPATGTPSLVITNAGGSVTTSGSSYITVAAGQKYILRYPLTGTPAAGVLSAKLTFNNLWVEASTTVGTQVSVTIPPHVTMGSGERSFVSIYDNSYTPYAGPASTIPTLGPVGSGSSPLVDYQGKITTTGVEVYIPITVANALGSGSVELPAYAGNPITIQPMYTEDNAGGKIVLTWEKQTIFQGTTYIKARIKAVGTEVNLKKLDFNGGIGGDYLGFHIGTFTYPETNGGTTRSEFKVRLTPGIPDRRFAIKTNGVYEHRFIYVAVKDPQNSRIWLNNNLGADYTNMDSPVFDPGQQATIHGDHHAFGSLFQFGRPADGHELVNYTNASTWAYKYTPTNVPATSYPNVGHGKTIIPDASTDHWGADNTPYWFGMEKPVGYPEAVEGNTDNSVCPAGFVLPDHGSIISVMNRTLPNEDMKEFAVRLPTNAFVNRDTFHFGNYPYAPKLWLKTSNRYDESAYGTPPATRTNTTNYYYAWFGGGTTDLQYSSGGWWRPNYTHYTHVNDNATDRNQAVNNNIVNRYVPHARFNGMYGLNRVWYRGRNDYGTQVTLHDPSSSFPIRCMKQ